LKAVYFFLRSPRGPEDAGYQHRSLAIAEGLKEIGVPVFANINYWRANPEARDTAFCFDEKVAPEDCEILVAEHVYFDEQKRLPRAFSDLGRKGRTVYIDASDGWRTPAMSEYSHGIDLVLKCHYSSRFDYGPNVKPWAFGLSQRLMDAAAKYVPGVPRTKTIISNFRANHPVRRLANERFLPLLKEHFEPDAYVDTAPPEAAYDRLMWEQSGRRHYPKYYARLCESAACSAFGGYFVPSFSRSLESLSLRMAYKICSVLRSPTRSIAQFDSWRFWEALAAGCLTFHVDLARYGCMLPVMPRNGDHYFGIDLSKPKVEASRVLASAARFSSIAEEGRRWALENYSPKATARRFIDYINNAG
jgi:hypothetical protein